MRSFITSGRKKLGTCFVKGDAQLAGPGGNLRPGTDAREASIIKYCVPRTPLIKAIRKQLRLNTPGDIRVAWPWYKPSKNAVDFEPDYFIHESAEWLVFPHELEGLLTSELAAGKSDLVNILGLFE